MAEGVGGGASDFGDFFFEFAEFHLRGFDLVRQGGGVLRIGVHGGIPVDLYDGM